MTDGPPSGQGGRDAVDMGEWIRLIGEVQRLGVDTARSVAARFGDLAESSLGRASALPFDTAVETWRSVVDQATDPDVQEQFTAAAQTLTSALVDMMQAAWEVFSSSVGDWGPGAGFGRQAASVDLGSVAPGGRTAGTAYVRIGSGAPSDEVKLHLGDLASAAGDVLDESASSLHPEIIESPGAGTAHEVVIRVVVPDDAVPGHYHGFLHVLSVPDGAIAVHIEIAGS